MAKEAPKQSLVGKSKNGGGGGKKTVPSSSKAVGSSIPKPSAASGKSIPKPSAPSRSSILEPGFASQGTSKGKPPASPKSRTAKQSKAGIVFPVTRLQNQLKKATGMRVNENAAVYMAAALEYITAEALELAGDQSFKGKRKRITPRDVMSGFRKDAELDKLTAHVMFPQAGVVATGPAPELMMKTAPKKTKQDTKTADDDDILEQDVESQEQPASKKRQRVDDDEPESEPEMEQPEPKKSKAIPGTRKRTKKATKKAAAESDDA